MPLSSSLVLLVLFLYFKYVQVLFVLLIAALCTVSLYTNIDTLVSRISCLAADGRLRATLCFFLAEMCLFEWFRSGNFVMHDILGCSICVSIIAMLHFPSLKVAAICLSGLLLYDIFWVFLSQYIFKKNVMLEVATREPNNPLQNLADEYLGISFQHTVSLPIKLIIPSSQSNSFMMLGLGDIALPGLLIAYALRCDRYSMVTKPVYDVEAATSSSRNGRSLQLFEVCLGCYCIGLCFAYYASYVWEHAQPALIYLVPAVIVPLVSRAYSFGCLSEVWSGVKVHD